MRSHISFRNAAFFAGGGLVAALFLNGVAHAITDSVFKYSTTKTGYFGLSPFAFAPSDFNYATRYIIQFGTLGMRPANAATTCLNAGVNLPQGATMTEINVLHESDIAAGVQLYLTRHRIGDGAHDFVVEKNSGNTAGARRLMRASIAAAMAVVDNQRYVYGVAICFNSASAAYFAGRITYTYASAGD